MSIIERKERSEKRHATVKEKRRRRIRRTGIRFADGLKERPGCIRAPSLWSKEKKPRENSEKRERFCGIEQRKDIRGHSGEKGGRVQKLAGEKGHERSLKKKRKTPSPAEEEKKIAWRRAIGLGGEHSPTHPLCSMKCSEGVYSQGSMWSLYQVWVLVYWSGGDKEGRKGGSLW